VALKKIKKRISVYFILTKLIKVFIIQLIVLFTLIIGIHYSLNKVNSIYDFYSVIDNTPPYQEGFYFFGNRIYNSQILILAILLFITLITISFIYTGLSFTIKRNKILIINSNKTYTLAFFILINLLLMVIIISHYIEPIIQNAITYNFYVRRLLIDNNIKTFKFWTIFGIIFSSKHYENLNLVLDILFVLIFIFIIGLIIVYITSNYKILRVEE